MSADDEDLTESYYRDLRETATRIAEEQTAQLRTRAECESWLNARVEELVASLGAVIVPGDAVEIAAQAIRERRLAIGNEDPSMKSEIGEHPHVSWVEKEYASAVLAALGMVKP